VSVHIFVSKFGRVDDEEVQQVVKFIEECYGRLAPHEVELVDLYLFETSSSVDAFLARESREMGVASAQLNDSFFAMHDAWRGTSRIILCIERLRMLPKLVQEGVIRHEVGHSVLHGELSYYLLSIPPVLLDLADRFHFPKEHAFNILYLVSIAVKDYEVSRLLTERGYFDDQFAYVEHILTVSEDDLLSWRISRGNPLAESLYLVSCLKTLSCAVPLISDERFSEKIKCIIRESLYYLPTEHSTMLLDFIADNFSSLGTDTQSNINFITNRAVERIIELILIS
jgi:hypothetical protein